MPLRGDARALEPNVRAVGAPAHRLSDGYCIKMTSDISTSRAGKVANGVVRASAAQKQRTRERIVEAASRRFRREGIDNVAVTDLMVSAVLTHGGFYKHLLCKTALVCEAMGRRSPSPLSASPTAVQASLEWSTDI